MGGNNSEKTFVVRLDDSSSTRDALLPGEDEGAACGGQRTQTATSSILSDPPTVEREFSKSVGGSSAQSATGTVEFASRTTIGLGDVPTTLYSILDPHKISFDELDSRHKAYKSLLKLVRQLISVAPNAVMILEMWPPAFKTYNVLVPGMLNLPFLLWGVTVPRHLVGISMYYSSRAHGCMYCSLHSCLFGLRRGTHPESIQGTNLSTSENILARTSFNLGSIPCRLTDFDRAGMRSVFSPSTEEYLVSAIAMMGFLNRFMHTICMPMESAGVAEALPVLGAEFTGWTTEENKVLDPQDERQEPGKAHRGKDTLLSNLSLVKFFPTVIAYENEVTKGVPSSWPKVSHFLFEKTGHTWPVLRRLKHSRTICTIATILSTNLDACESSLDMEIKYFSGMVFAACVKNRLLFHEIQKIALNLCPEMSKDTVDAVGLFAWDESVATTVFTTIELDKSALSGVEGLSYSDQMTLFFAKAVSSTPMQTPPAILEIADVVMTKPQVVEMTTWLGVCNLIHRLECYYMPESYDGARAAFDEWGDAPL